MNKISHTILLLTCMILPHAVFANNAMAQESADDKDLVIRPSDTEDRRVDEQPEDQPHDSISSILSEYAQDGSSLLNDIKIPEKEYKINDIIKVRISESVSTKDSSILKTKRSFEIDATLDKYFQLSTNTNSLLPKFVAPNTVAPGIELDSTVERKNKGQMDKKSSFQAILPGKVVDVKPNGTLVISCEKSIVNNEEEQTFRLTGLISKDDIGAGNFVDSSSIANMQLEYQGVGPVNDTSRRGLIGKIFDTIWPFK